MPAPTSQLKKLIRALMVAIALTASIGLIAACGGDDDSSSDSGGSDAADSTATSEIPSLEDMSLEGKKVAFVNAGPLEYYDFSEESAKLAVEALGGEFVAYNSNFDVQEEQAQVRNAITQGADAVIIIPLSTAGVASDLNLLRQADIPGVMVYGWSPDQIDNGAGFVQVNFYDYGKLVGEEMAKLVPDGDVAIITGQPGRAEIPQGSQGFRDGFGDDSRIVDEVPGNWQRQDAFNQTKTLMTKHPNLKGIFAQNDDMGVGVVRALGNQIDDVVVGSMNGSPIGLEFLADGRFGILAGNSIPIEQGQAVRYAASALNGIELEPKICYTDIALVEDVDTWEKTWVPSPELAQEGLQAPCVEGATDPLTVPELEGQEQG